LGAVDILHHSHFASASNQLEETLAAMIPCWEKLLPTLVMLLSGDGESKRTSGIPDP